MREKEENILCSFLCRMRVCLFVCMAYHHFFIARKCLFLLLLRYVGRYMDNRGQMGIMEFLIFSRKLKKQQRELSFAWVIHLLVGLLVFR